ncbi:hypothetical protein [Actinoplanes subtropicus]|uniref:hypothetical protein n=1 Tax=Actinoplanes subtropicus TaxID=543632 RepID=UPI0004C2DDC1|nr:hypothetical protein [Actinoplanes subtropicus]
MIGLGLIGALTACATPATATDPPGVAVAATQRPCGTHVVADESANGSTVCVAASSDVTIMLKTAGDSSWSSPTATGHVLGPAMPLPTPYGLVGWQFRTIAAGQAEIRTARPGVLYQLYVTVR